MKNIYEKIYKIIGELTPLKTDCGELCNGACCKGDEEMGMYLYPGEDAMYEDGVSFGKVVSSDFTYFSEGQEKPVPIFICNGTCIRNMRPLSCRIFPFVPYTDINGDTEIRLDPRADGLCPLADNGDTAEFDERFLDSLAEAFSVALENPEIAAFIEEQSRFLDEIEEEDILF